MDLQLLREILSTLIHSLKDFNTHPEIPKICERIGLPTPDDEGTKAERLSGAFHSLSDVDLPRVAERLLHFYPPKASIRNTIQDILWSDSFSVEIPKKYRRDIARSLSNQDLFIDANRFIELLNKLWVLENELELWFDTTDRSLRSEIERHVIRNPGDWTTEKLFDRLGAFDASDKRFALFLEGLAFADVRPDEDDQRRFVEIVNGPLLKCGLELRETGVEGGYPLFQILEIHSASKGRPKNIIFASSVKLDFPPICGRRHPSVYCS